MNKSLIASAVCLVLPVVAGAKGLGQQNLEEIVVTATKSAGSLTSLSVEQARSTLEQIPGGIGFVEVTDYQNNFTQSLGDTLVYTPGVYADTSAQRENRISIRGSGLNSGFERRGISVYRDGVPITRASGITEFQEIDPLSVKYIEVFKGSNGLRYGANALGGAINIVTPTGRNSQAGSNLRLEAGSFGSSRVNVASTGRTESMDYYAALTKLDSDGFRTHSEVDSVYGFANLGFALSDSIESRFYITSLKDQFELVGSVSQEDALNKPDSAVGGSFVPAQLPFLGGPGLYTAVDDDWDRNLTVKRLANRTVVGFDRWSLEAGVWYADRALDHAITRYAGMVVQDETERGVSLRASNEAEVLDGLIWSLGASFNQAENDAKTFRNEFGERGVQSSQNYQDAENANIFGQLSYPLVESLRVVVGAQYVRSVRENEHSPLNEFDIEDDSGSLTYDEIAPRIGLLWKWSDQQQGFINLSRAYEAPGISDLTSAGVLPFDPLAIQKSTTLEIGTRGHADQWAWDLAIYRSELDDEFIDFTDGRITNTVNSSSGTVHQGAEVGLDWLPSFEALRSHGWQLAWRNIVTVNDFSFDNHSLYGNNTLAGVPEFSYLSDMSIAGENWTAGISVRYVKDGPYADYANSVQTEGYTLLGLSVAWQLNDHIRVFASGENLSDQAYVSNVATVGIATPDEQIFTPGQGRAAYAGISIDF
ncbi:TonB-dependent receptor family protein [Arenicella xantha]|uniref:Iron complex outermembrane receptor protein n=1 Tax=Arenicella xantha TaxID=644221 RepID=A0A395JMQ9_9GAMM|nr:TonB-dependent receptor [Arenicella xantha]RBP51107.1 iron complex outermembrane receptor protein [Arenicella xantha]